MPKRVINRNKEDPNSKSKSKRRAASTPEGRENQLIALAYDAAEERIRNGTASSAEIVHFLKLGSSKERLEQEDKRKDIELKIAKTEALQSMKHSEELFTNAIEAMKQYSGHGNEQQEE